jgi:hypothetical protein
MLTKDKEGRTTFCLATFSCLLATMAVVGLSGIVSYNLVLNILDFVRSFYG